MPKKLFKIISEHERDSNIGDAAFDITAATESPDNI